MSVELSGEITAIATSVLAFFAIITAAFAFLAFRKQSQEVGDQAKQLEVQSEQLRLQREANIMQAGAFVRDRVFTILNGEFGLRSIIALDDDDGKTGMRVKLLQRTAEQLDVAGAQSLGEKLRKVLAFGEPGWGTSATDKSRSVRNEFVNSAKQFMNASAS